LLYCQLLPCVFWVSHVGYEVLERDGILESLVDNFRMGVECKSRQEAQPGFACICQWWSIALTPAQSRSSGSKLVDEVIAIFAERVIHHLGKYPTVERKVLEFLDDLLVVVSVGKDTFEHGYLTVPSETGFLPPFSLSQAWSLRWFLKYFCTTVMCLVMADGVQSLTSSCSQCAEHSYTMMSESCSNKSCLIFSVDHAMSVTTSVTSLLNSSLAFWIDPRHNTVQFSAVFVVESVSLLSGKCRLFSTCRQYPMTG